MENQEQKNPTEAEGSVELFPDLTPLQRFHKEVSKKDSELESVDLSLEALGPWSNSKYKTLKKCPFQYYLKYILKAKVPPELQLQTDPTSAAVGTAAHAILENILLGKTVDKAYAMVKKEFIEKKILSEEVWESKVVPLENNITRFQERIQSFERQNPIRRVLTELRIGLNRQFEPVGFFADDVWLRGVVDLILILNCQDAIIIDHKTGGGQGPITPFKEQLDWYKVLLHLGISKMRGVQTGIHFIGEGEVKMGDYSPASEIEGNMKNALEMSLEGAVDALREKGYFKHVRGAYCKWCEFDNIGCKDGTFKQLELNTKKFFPIKSI